MTKATIHTFFILLILLTGSGCSRIQQTPTAPVDACPVEPALDARLSIKSCPDDTFAPGTPGRDPEMSVRYHYLTFLMLHRQNRIDDAMAALEKAITLDTDASFLKRDLIRMYLSMDQEETALALAESLVAETPDNVENLLLLARLKKDDTRGKNMPPLLQRILELDPDNRETYLRLGKIYMENQQIPEALALFSRMADRLPDYYVAHFYLGKPIFFPETTRRRPRRFKRPSTWNRI